MIIPLAIVKSMVSDCEDNEFVRVKLIPEDNLLLHYEVKFYKSFADALSDAVLDLTDD